MRRLAEKYQKLTDGYRDYQEFWEPTKLALMGRGTPEGEIRGLKRDAQHVAEKIYYCKEHAKELAESIGRVAKEFDDAMEKMLRNMQMINAYNAEMQELIGEIEEMEEIMAWGSDELAAEERDENIAEENGGRSAGAEIGDEA